MARIRTLAELARECRDSEPWDEIVITKRQGQLLYELLEEVRRLREKLGLRHGPIIDCMIVGCDDPNGPWVPFRSGLLLCERHYDEIVAHALMKRNSEESVT